MEYMHQPTLSARSVAALLVISMAVGLPIAAQEPAPTTLRGFTTASSAKQFEIESKFKALISPEREKEFHRNECGALVAVHERMISRDSKSIGGCEIGMVGRFVRRQVERASECRLKEAGVAHPGAPAMLGQLGIVDCDDDLFVNPLPCCHFASSRRTARRSFMISRAAFI